LIVKAIELTRVYRLGSSQITAVDKVNLQVDEANLVSIIGPSGSGKTTLLHLIGLNDTPTSGKILFNGDDTSLLSESERRKTRLQRMGFIFQTFNLLPTLTALENVELPMALAKFSQKEQREKTVNLLETVGLAERFQHRPKQLSAGEMQRVAIARALANNPSLILADEPTGELDSKAGCMIINLLSELCKSQNIAVVLATHDERIAEVSDVTYRTCDGVITLE